MLVILSSRPMQDVETSKADNQSGLWANRIDYLLLIAALVSGTVLMMPFLTAGPLTLDEYCSYWLLESDVL